MKLNQLTTTRFIAAILIVFYHFGSEVYSQFHAPIQTVIKRANLGVSFFFILSGFVMIIAYSKKTIDLKEYYFNRIARIYPSYLLALLLTIGYHIARHTTLDVKECVLGVLGIQAWIPKYATTLNFTGWSLSVELFFYALFPFLLKYIYQQYSLKKVSYIIVLIWIISQLFLHLLLKQQLFMANSNFIYFSPIMHLSSFLIGNCAGLFYLEVKATSYKKTPFHILTLGLVVLLYYLIKTPLPFDFHNGLLAVIYVPLILLISLQRKPFYLLKLNVFVFLGEISYGIYIYQLPIYLFTPAILRRLHLEMSFYGYLAILLIFCTINYWLVETKLRKWIINTRFQ